MSVEKDALRERSRGAEEELNGEVARRVDTDASDDRDGRVVACITPSGSPAVLTDAFIAATAAQIQDLAKRTHLAFAYRVGEIVINNFYGGDFADWRSRGEKAASIRKLVRHLRDGNSMSRSTLHRCIETYALLRDRGGVSTWRHVSVSHVRSVLPLRDETREIELLRRAEEGEWSVRELARAVQARSTKRQRKPQQEQECEQPTPPNDDVIVCLTDRLERDANALLTRLREESPKRRGLRQRVFGGVVRTGEVLDTARSLTSPKRRD